MDAVAKTDPVSKMNAVVKIVSEVLGLPVTAESSMENTEGWDSLKTLQIVMALDEAGMPVPLETHRGGHRPILEAGPCMIS